MPSGASDEEELELDDLVVHELAPEGPSTHAAPHPALHSDEDRSEKPPRMRWLDADAPKPLRPYVWAFAIVTSLALLYEYSLIGFGNAGLSSMVAGVARGPYMMSYGDKVLYPGWGEIEHVFIFGDSWTTTGFEIEGDQPSRENPMGNPDYAPPDNTSTLGAGTNWVPFLTGLHNASFVQTINIAYGGATVDMELIHPFDVIPPGMRPLKYQVEEQFVPNYASEAPLVDWKNSSTLFAIWIGLNDIHNATPKTAMVFGRVFEEFAEFVDELYQAGARNFMFINIPPIERSPLAFKIEQVEPWTAWVAAWNQNVTTLASNLSAAYSDSTSFVFDTFKLYNTVIDDPCSHPETCDFLDTTTFCDMYAFGAAHWNSTHENCTHRVDQYLWMNDIHPTTRMHNLTALEMAKALT